MSWQNSANQARSDAQRGMQNASAAQRRTNRSGRKPRSFVGRVVAAIFNLIGFVLALAVFATVAVVGYYIVMHR